MTDPTIITCVYLLPLTTKSMNSNSKNIHKLIRFYPTMGGQTALKSCLEADEKESGTILM
jgi:carbamoylphosphate synthase large subunit